MVKVSLANDALFRKIRVMANEKRFRILELTQTKALNITQISNEIKFPYTKSADYIGMLEKENLVSKTRKGREIFIKAKVLLNKLECTPKMDS